MRSRKRLLAFVEDPGAANFVGPLLRPLRTAGWEARLFANGSAHKLLSERGIEAYKVLETHDAYLFIDEISPDVVLVGTSENPATLGLSLITAAKHSRVLSVGVLDSPANSAFRFRGRSEEPLDYCPDWLLVPDELTRSEFLTLGYPSSRIVLCGHPYYDEVRRVGANLEKQGRVSVKQRVFANVPPEVPVLMFLAEVSDGLNPSQYRRSSGYTLHGRGGSDERTHIVLEELIDALAEIQQDHVLVLRLHPKNRREEFSAYWESVHRVSQGGDALELVYAADLVVGMSSSLLVEAALIGRPTLSIVPRAVECDWLPNIKRGITPCVSNRESLREILSSYLSGEIRMQNSIGHFSPPKASLLCIEALNKILAIRNAG